MTALKIATCEHCGARIYLIKTGVHLHKWVTDSDDPQKNWKCGNDPDFPVKSHSPKNE